MSEPRQLPVLALRGSVAFPGTTIPMLALRGFELDPLGGEVWMPSETAYSPLFAGRFVTLLVADAESILLSKGLKAPRKNQPLLTEYLACGASPRFLTLAKKYRLNLEQFV